MKVRKDGDDGLLMLSNGFYILFPRPYCRSHPIKMTTKWSQLI